MVPIKLPNIETAQVVADKLYVQNLDLIGKQFSSATLGCTVLTVPDKDSIDKPNVRDYRRHVGDTVWLAGWGPSLKSADYSLVATAYLYHTNLTQQKIPDSWRTQI